MRNIMNKMVLRIYQMEVKRQCKFALIAAQDINNALQYNDMDRIWYSIQAFVVAVGNISKILWPSNALLPERGADIRKSLLVDDDSPLGPRKFRNHFEHFDERLEIWATSSEHMGLVDSNVGPPGMIAGHDPGDYLRNFDTRNFAVTFWGDEYVLPPIVTAVQELRQKATVEAGKPHWE
jgi:hypothetical protein